MEETMAHPNEELARSGYKAFADGDLDAIGGIFAEDVVWHISGSSPLARDYRGKDEVLGFLGNVMSATGGTFRAEVHDILANDEHAVVIVTVSAERDGKKLSTRQVAVYHNRDGQQTEAWFCFEDTTIADAMFS